ncbi:MAG TPA: site-specific integrase [Waddliaceae bacterium]
MASIQKRINKNGTSHWRVLIRLKGYPTVCNHFDRKKEAEDWAQAIERQIKAGKYKFERANHQRTFLELTDRYKTDGLLDHLKSAKDVLRHLEYWKGRLGAYALVHLHSDLLSKERALLLETPIAKRLKRNSATVNRYIASLSSCLSYAKKLRWIDENPCSDLTKLKESKGRDRTLNADEADRLLAECRESQNPYLYCITLMAITTGMRQGEILKLEWSHMDLEAHIAHIKESKNGRPRSVPLVSEIVEELKKLYNVRNPAKTLAFASKTAFGKIDIKKAWQVAAKKAGLNDVHFHDLRHTYSTEASKQGASTIELSTAMGHRTLQMLDRYTHMQAQMTRQYSEGIVKKFNLKKHKEQADAYDGQTQENTGTFNGI